MFAQLPRASLITLGLSLLAMESTNAAAIDLSPRAGGGVVRFEMESNPEKGSGIMMQSAKEINGVAWTGPYWNTKPPDVHTFEFKDGNEHWWEFEATMYTPDIEINHYDCHLWVDEPPTNDVTFKIKQWKNSDHEDDSDWITIPEFIEDTVEKDGVKWECEQTMGLTHDV